MSGIESGGGDLTFSDAYRILLRYRWLIIGFTIVVGTSVFLLNYFVLPPWFEARAQIMPKVTRSASSLDSLFGQATHAGSAGGLSSLLSGSAGTSSELLQFQEVLRSRNLFEHVFQKDPELLKTVRGQKASVTNPRDLYLGMVRIQKYLNLKIDGLSLHIRYQHTNPEFSRKVVAALLVALQDFLTHNVVTQSQSAAVFVKERLTELNKELDSTESYLMRLKSGDRSLITSGRPLQSEIHRTEREFLRLDNLVTLLSQQNELAQIESKRNDPMFITIDTPSLPIVPESPDIQLNTILGFFLSFTGICCALLLGKTIFKSKTLATYKPKSPQVFHKPASERPLEN